MPRGDERAPETYLHYMAERGYERGATQLDGEGDSETR